MLNSLTNWRDPTLSWLLASVGEVIKQFRAGEFTSQSFGFWDDPLWDGILHLPGMKDCEA